MWWVSFLLLSWRFSVFVFWQLDYNESQYWSLWFYPTWSSLYLLIYRFMYSLKLWKLIIISSNNFSSSLFLSTPSQILTMPMFVYFMVYHWPVRCCSIFFIHFSPCVSDWIISIDLLSNSLTLSSFWWNLLLRLSSEFSLHFSFITLFNFRISIWVF